MDASWLDLGEFCTQNMFGLCLSFISGEQNKVGAWYELFPSHVLKDILERRGVQTQECFQKSR